MNFYTKEYYEKLMRENNYDPIHFGRIDFELGNLPKSYIQKRWLCHHDANKFSQLFNDSPDTSIITTGIGLSGAPHMGTLSQITKAIKLQEAGLNVQFVLGDLDSYNGKQKDMEYVRKLAEIYNRFIKDLGFDSKKGILRKQYDSVKVLRTMYILGKYMSDEMFDKSEEDLYRFYKEKGKVDSYMTYRRKLSLALMAADFFDLVREGYDNILVMLGVDEHQYVQFAKETAKNVVHSGELKKYVPKNLAGLYSSMIKGFNGYPKMSKSFPKSSLNLDMDVTSISQRILSGDNNERNPSENVIFQIILSTSNFEDPEMEYIYEECQNNSSEWIRIKEKYLKELLYIKSKWEDAKNVH